MADPLVGCPERPDWLAADALASGAWDCLTGLLLERRVLSRADGPALELLVTTYVLWRRVAATLTADGVAVETATGSFKPSPELAACDRLGRLLLSLLGEFGLTPRSRPGVVPIVSIGADPLDEFLSADPIASKIRIH
jgi:P27 family predicted phage terminase small subunit